VQGDPFRVASETLATKASLRGSPYI